MGGLIFQNTMHPDAKRDEHFLGIFDIANFENIKYKSKRIAETMVYSNGLPIKDKNLVPVIVLKSEIKK